MILSSPQYRFLSNHAEWIVAGGAAGGGKTHMITLDPLRHCQGPGANKAFRGAIFRRTHPQLTNPGGLIDHCKAMYGPLNARFNHTRSEFAFPCGAEISMSTLQFEKDLQNFQGAQLDWVAFDEATQFPLKYVQFLWSRVRSKSGIRGSLRMTCNPDSDSWIFPFISWWINLETGYPIKERSGVIRHFRNLNSEHDQSNARFMWYDEPQFEIDEKTGKQKCVTTSATFIGATLDDNEFLQKSDPGYRQRLEQLNEQERERFLNGCWLASSKTDTEWPRECFMGVTVPLSSYPVPEHHEVVRMFSVDPSKGKHIHKGDYSAIVCLAQTQTHKFIDADMARRPPGQIVRDLFEFCDQPHHRIRQGDLIGIESLQFQSIMRDLIYQHARDNPHYALSAFLASGGIIIPVEDQLKKEMRIRRLDGPIRNRELRFLENSGTAILLSQLKNFDGIPGVNKHDDGPDALDQANRMPIHLQTYYENLRKA